MGKEVNYVGINMSAADAWQMELTKKCSFPLLQDQTEINAWGLLGAGKDDFLLYDSNGKLVQHLPAFGGINVDLSTMDGYKNVRDAILKLK